MSRAEFGKSQLKVKLLLLGRGAIYGSIYTTVLSKMLKYNTFKYPVPFGVQLWLMFLPCEMRTEVCSTLSLSYL